MQINWKARFRNKAFIVIMATLIVSVIYQMLGMFGIVPAVSQGAVLDVIRLVIKILVGFGVLIDPTTDGVSDSDRAMTYYTDHDERKKEDNDSAAYDVTTEGD